MKKKNVAENIVFLIKEYPIAIFVFIVFLYITLNL
jgi:hypothetical protein